MSPRCGLASLAITLAVVGCAVAPRSAQPTRDVAEARYENPPGSAKRTPIITRLPTLIARFVKHGFAPQTLDRDHVVPHAEARTLLESFGERNAVTWIGHMTALLRIDGVTILTDPWWADVASPVAGLGPKRYVPPALALDELPPIDVVIVSHSHYDHLDVGAIEALPGRARTTAVVPLGVGRFFRDAGYAAVFEVNWRESVDVRGVRFTALPAIHWSKRTLLKTNDSLWASFAIEGPSGSRVYFGGDSDYGPVHANLSDAFGGFDLALLSIGGFHNEGVHCAPEDCVLLGKDVGARAMVPMHWGTIYLGEGPPPELPARFVSAALQQGFAVEDVWLMRIGETRALPQPSARAPRATLARSTQ